MWTASLQRKWSRLSLMTELVWRAHITDNAAVEQGEPCDRCQRLVTLNGVTMAYAWRPVAQVWYNPGDVPSGAA